MGIVYILQSEVNGRYYVGSTNNLRRRILEHNNGQSKYTNLTKPFKLMFSKEYSTLGEARKIEYKLKKFKRRDILEKIIESGEIKLRISSSVG